MQTLPQMAQGDANKVWIVPSDFGDALKGFAKQFGSEGPDGVFRYEPSAASEDVEKPEDDSDDVAGWFESPAIPTDVSDAEAAAIAAATRPPFPGYTASSTSI